MSQDSMAVVIFYNTQSAIRAEQLLQGQGVAGKLIPVPRQFSSTCGLAFRFPQAETGRVQALLEQAGIGYSAIHNL